MRTTITTREYACTAVFEPAEEGGFIVTFPALSVPYHRGETLEHARAMASEALRGYLESLAKDRLSAPAEVAQPSMSLIRETVAAVI